MAKAVGANELINQKQGNETQVKVESVPETVS